MISKTAEYALRAALYIARSGTGDPVRASDLATALHVPSNYLSKILHTLTRSGILLSVRGRHGGFRLALPSSDLPLTVVIEPFDRLRERSRCLLGGSRCSDQNPCPAHDRWKHLHEQVADFFQRTTLADLLQDAPKRLGPPQPIA